MVLPGVFVHVHGPHTQSGQSQLCQIDHFGHLFTLATFTNFFGNEPLHPSFDPVSLAFRTSIDFITFLKYCFCAGKGV